MNSEYGHVGIVTGVRTLNSPCCNVEPETVELPVDESGFTPFYTVCKKCKKEYNSQEITII